MRYFTFFFFFCTTALTPEHFKCSVATWACLLPSRLPPPESKLLLPLTQLPVPISQEVSQLPSLFASIHSPCSNNDSLLKTETQHINRASSLPCLIILLYCPAVLRTEWESLRCITGCCVTGDCGPFQTQSKHTPPAHANLATLHYFQLHKLSPTQDLCTRSPSLFLGFSQSPGICL